MLSCFSIDHTQRTKSLKAQSRITMNAMTRITSLAYNERDQISSFAIWTSHGGYYHACPWAMLWKPYRKTDLLGNDFADIFEHLVCLVVVPNGIHVPQRKFRNILDVSRKLAGRCISQVLAL